MERRGEREWKEVKDGEERNGRERRGGERGGDMLLIRYIYIHA